MPAPQFSSPRNNDQSQYIDYEQADGGYNTNPDLASFTPDIEHDQAYIPSTGGYTGQRYQNPNYVPNQQPQPNQHNGRPQINHSDLDPNQWSQGARRPGAQDIGGIRARYESMDAIVNMVGGNGISANRDDNDEYAVGVAIETLEAAIETLTNAELWCPRRSAKAIPNLDVAGQKLSSQLRAYINVLVKLK